MELSVPFRCLKEDLRTHQYCLFHPTIDTYSFYPLLSFSFALATVCVCRWTTMPGWQGGTYVLPMPALTLRIQAKTASWPRGHRTNSKAEGVRCCCERQFIYPYGAVRLTSTTVTTTYPQLVAIIYTRTRLCSCTHAHSHTTHETWGKAYGLLAFWKRTLLLSNNSGGAFYRAFESWFLGFWQFWLTTKSNCWNSSF